LHSSQFSLIGPSEFDQLLMSAGPSFFIALIPAMVFRAVAWRRSGFGEAPRSP
jgi:hypothetical protein